MSIASAIRRCGSTIQRCGKLRRFFFSSSFIPWPTGQVDCVTKRKDEDGHSSRIPCLMVSPSSRPEIRCIYEVVQDAKCLPRLKLMREIYLPEIAGDCFIGSSDGFLFSLPTGYCSNLCAFNPFTGRRLSLPPTASLPQQSIDPYPYQAIHRGAAENVTIDSNYIDLLNAFVTLSPSLDIAILTLKDRRCDCDDEAYIARLTSTSTPQWIPFPLPNINLLCDSVFHKNRLILVNVEGSIATFRECGDPFRPRPVLIYCLELAEEREKWDEYHRGHLVESPDGEDLFMVWRVTGYRKTSHILVFKLDPNDVYKWKKVDTLGGLAFFIGTGRSISVRALDHPGRLKPDSIYFTVALSSDHFSDPSGEGLGDTGVFNMQDKTFQRFQFAQGESELNWPPPIWVVPAAC